jgi:hypothetical protein
MADSSVAITAGSGTPIRVLTALGAGTADQQVITPADSAGTLVGNFGAAGQLPTLENPVRTIVSASTAVAGLTTPGTTTTDTILTCSLFFRALTSVGSNTTFAITNAKTFRIQAVTIGIKNNAAAVATAVFSVRAATAGSTTVASAPITQLMLALAATTGLSNTFTWTPEGGYDIPGAASGTANSFGISAAVTFASTAPTLFASIVGYEY